MIAIAIATGQNSAGLDPAASAFIQATGITGELQKAAINNLVLNLKKYNLWSKMKAVYPFVTDNRNLVDYSEDFSNSAWAKIRTTVSPNTTTAPNGTLTADSLLDGTASGSHAVSTFKTAFGQNGNNTSTIYAKANTLNYLWMYFYNGLEPAGVYAFFNLSNGTVGTVQSGITATIENAGNGWYRCSITRNFNFTAANSNCGYGVSNADNVLSYLGTNQSIYIWGAQVENGSTATTYQPIATTQQAFIASQFKYNLVNPIDSDAAFRLVFNGGWTHSSNGATPNGTNGYADTKLVPSSVLTNNNTHLSFYSRSTTAANVGVEIGAATGGSSIPLIELACNYTAVGSLHDHYSYTNGRIIVATANSFGFYNGTRTSSTSLKAYKNGALVGTLTTANTEDVTSINRSIAISAINTLSSVTAFSNRESAFTSIGDGLTDDDATNLYYSTQVFQTTLGRQVGSPAYALPAVNDVNAKLYLSAINSSDPTVNGAVDTFISGLKTDGIYSKMKAVYPFATDNRNLMSYTEDFGNAYWFKQQGGITANTVTAPNGTTTADSFLEDTALTTHGVLKSFTLSSATAHTYSVYVKQLNGREALTIRFGSSNVDGVNGTYIGAVTFTFATQVISGDNLTSSVQILPNGWYRLSVTVTPPTTSLSIALWSNNGSTVNFAGDVTKGFNLWGAQLELGSTATTYQPIETTQQAYIATQFKYNMINPQDDDSAFRLVFNGGWTHSPQGALPNGTNGYADTKLNENTTMTLNNIHMSVYSRTNNTISSCDIGCLDSSNSYGTHIIPYSGGNAAIRNTDLSAGFTATSSTAGLFINSRISSAQSKYFYNASLFNTIVSPSISKSNQVYFLSARNSGGTATLFSTKQLAFNSIGEGLTDTQAANLYSRVQNLQTLLNRQV